MMRWLVAISVVLAAILPAAAEDWKTADGKTYQNVTVVNQADDGVTITFTGGVGKIPYYELPVDLQKRFGQDIDSLTAKRQAIDQAAGDAVVNAAAAEVQKQQDDAAAAEEQKTHPTANAAPANAASGANGQPTTSLQAGTKAPSGPPAQPGQNGPSAPAPEAPLAESQASTSPAPSDLTGGAYPGAKYSYNDSLDVCYLDSPAVNVWPDPEPTAATSPAQGTTLALRIITEGHDPQAPEKIEATFLSANVFQRPPGSRDVVFSVDGAQIPIGESAKKGNGYLSNAGQVVEYVSFYLTPGQTKTIFKGNNARFSVGTSNYKIDDTGMAAFRSYLDDVEKLPSAAPSIVQMYLRFLSRLPSLVTMISTACEYIILGGFAVLVAASIAAFVMGMSRFIKM